MIAERNNWKISLASGERNAKREISLSENLMQCANGRFETEETRKGGNGSRLIKYVIYLEYDTKLIQKSIESTVNSSKLAIDNR